MNFEVVKDLRPRDKDLVFGYLRISQSLIPFKKNLNDKSDNPEYFHIADIFSTEKLGYVYDKLPDAPQLYKTLQNFKLFLFSTPKQWLYVNLAVVIFAIHH